MRINYIHKQEDGLKAYVNVFLSKPNSKDYSYNIDETTQDAQATEIRAEYVLEQFEWPLIDDIINYWIKKLRINGKLTIIGTELYTLAKSVVTRNLNITGINQALFSNSRKSVLSIFELEECLTAKGLKVTQKRVDGYSYCITAERTT